MEAGVIGYLGQHVEATARKQELEVVTTLPQRMMVLPAQAVHRKKLPVREDLVLLMEIGAPGVLGPHVPVTAKRPKLEVVTTLLQSMGGKLVLVLVKAK